MDIKLFRNEENGVYDLRINENGELVTDGGLETSVLISLLTNRRASDTELPDSFNRYGWWADTYRNVNKLIGSKLYQLKQAKNISETLENVRGSIEDSLNWMIGQGISQRNIVAVIRTGIYSADIVISIYRPSGVSEFNFQFAWDDVSQ